MGALYSLVVGNKHDLGLDWKCSPQISGVDCHRTYKVFQWIFNLLKL